MQKASTQRGGGRGTLGGEGPPGGLGVQVVSLASTVGSLGQRPVGSWGLYVPGLISPMASRAWAQFYGVCKAVRVCVLSCFSCFRFCDLFSCSLPGSSVQGFLQARILEWVALPSSGEPSWPRDQTRVSCLAGGVFTIWAIKEAGDFSLCLLHWQVGSLQPAPPGKPLQSRQALSG